MLTEKLNDLFSQQLSDWELAKNNYAQLRSVKTKRIAFNGFEVVIQFNPERIRSSAAKVDAKSIEARPCFLCKANRPVQQKDLSFNNEYAILVNPYPVFSRHLTITKNEHTDQRIKYSFPAMLQLAGELPGYIVFYNGPECGASAPDHLHFQAVEKGFIPLEHDFSGGRFTERAAEKYGTGIWLWKNYLRGILSLKGNDMKGLVNAFKELYSHLSGIQPGKPEPMLNILAYCGRDGFTVHVIPRKVHRPAQFFGEGAKKILVSPAAIDLGGVIITPREEDYEKLEKNEISDIFKQVCFDENELQIMMKDIL